MQFLKIIGKVLLKLIRLILSLAFAFGVALLFVNMLGLVIPLRNPAIYAYNDGKDVSMPNNNRDISLTYQETMQQIDKSPGESDVAYLYRLTHVVNQSLAHYWLDEGIDTYRMRIPIWENYILWGESIINPRTYLRYEITDYQLALKRGIGLCSEHAIVMDEILARNGIEAKIIGLSGHVVASAKAGGQWYITDADYGVVIPHSIEEIEQNPEIVHQAYLNSWNPDLLTSIYASKEDNIQFNSVSAYSTPKKVNFEITAYQLKWVIPAGLMAPNSVLLLTLWTIKRRQTQKNI